MPTGAQLRGSDGGATMSAVFDHAGSLRRMGNDPNLFQEMIGFLIADAPKLLSRATAARESGDWPQVERAAHTLKGLVSNFGAQRATSAASSVEQFAKAGDEAAIARLLPELQRAVRELESALAPYAENE